MRQNGHDFQVAKEGTSHQPLPNLTQIKDKDNENDFVLESQQSVN